jgi:putative nucleotidyltransferase with HDIG domain
MQMKDLVKDFQIKMPHWVKAMKQSNHHYEKGGEVVSINPYHIESDVFSHTMQVCLMAELVKANKLVKYAAILHDVGKPLSRENKDDRSRVAFIGHEGLSAYMALDYLKQTDLTDEEIIHVVKLISLHTVVFHMMEGENWEFKVAEKFVGQSKLLEDLLVLGYCDARGRFMEEEFTDSLAEFQAKFELVFEAIKELEANKQEEKKKTVVILVGPPNAGKSTFLKTFAQNDLVLCRDEVITSLHPKLSYDEAYRKTDSKEVDRLFNDLVQKAAREKVEKVYFDLTNMSPKSRRRNLGAFGKEYKTEMVVFLTSYEDLMSRNKNRSKSGKSIPEKVMISMMQKFLFPLADEADEVKVILKR